MAQVTQGFEEVKISENIGKVKAKAGAQQVAQPNNENP
jgi:hypothetical protein